MEFRIWKNILPTVAIALLVNCFYGPAYAEDFNYILVNEHANFQLCGNLPYQRLRRDCTALPGLEFKECLEREKSDPMYVRQDTSEYLCINSQTKKGVEILEQEMNLSQDSNGCMSKKIKSLYGEVLSQKSFQDMIKRYSKMIGKNVKVSYGIDTQSNIAYLQMDLSEASIPGYAKSNIELNWSQFSENGPCGNWNSTAMIQKLDAELSTIAMVKEAKEKYDPLEGAVEHFTDVYNHNKRQVKGTIPSDSRSPAQLNNASQ